MVFPGSSQVTNQGNLQFVNNSFNYLQFSFDLSLKGGQYQCKTIDYVVDVNPTSPGNKLDICFFDRNNENRWVADFEILFMRDGDYNSSHFFGGNDRGAMYGNNQVAQWQHDTYQRYFTEPVYWTNVTNHINLAFNQVCIVNACGTQLIYCPGYTNFTGSFIIHGFTTTTPIEPNYVNSTCAPSATPIVDSPTHLPTSTPSTATPTARPSREPTAKPSRQPTLIPSAKPTVHPSVRPTARRTVVPTARPSAVRSNQPSRQPSNQPTNQPSVLPLW